MSFRLFVYYCALCGGCAALLGWLAGRAVVQGRPALPGNILEVGMENSVGEAGIKALLLGVMLALGLSLVDAWWNLPRGQIGQLVLRVLSAVVVGGVGGLVGGMVGQVLYGLNPLPVFLILGWTITGQLIGASLGVFDLLWHFIHQENTRGARRKMFNGILGGTLGGLAGGLLFLLSKAGWTGFFHAKPADQLWSPSAMGFVALGVCIGLAIALAQVVLKEAWVRVAAGFRPGREKILFKAITTIGRAEQNDIGMFGDAAIDLVHARIQQDGKRYYLVDAGSRSGTFLNGHRIQEPTSLKSGDVIHVGNGVLHFGERNRKSE